MWKRRRQLVFFRLVARATHHLRLALHLLRFDNLIELLPVARLPFVVVDFIDVSNHRSGSDYFDTVNMCTIKEVKDFVQVVTQQFSDGHVGQQLGERQLHNHLVARGFHTAVLGL